MLTKEHSIVNYKGRAIIPDRLNRQEHKHYIEYAKKAIEIYKSGIGQTRISLHKKVRNIFKNEENCPLKRINSFCKLLDDVSIFDRDRGGKSEKLRKKVFLLAAEYHPIVKTNESLFDNQEDKVKQIISKKLKIEWKIIEKNLFSDIIDFHRLKSIEEYPSAITLLSRYNIAQIQATLYRAINMTIWIKNDLKRIVRYAKMLNLLHKITYLGNGEYKIFFDGPASILRNTQRYGVSMATFFPVLTTSKNWKMRVLIKSKFKSFDNILELSDKDKLKSHLPITNDFDSIIEEQFYKKWGTGSRNGWKLERESEIIHNGQRVFFPDFVFRHNSGAFAYLEIVGFWTPEYLKHKSDTLQFFKEHKTIIAVADSVKNQLSYLPDNSIAYKKSINIKDVLERLIDYV